MSGSDRFMEWAVIVLCLLGIACGGYLCLVPGADDSNYVLLGSAIAGFNCWNLTRLILVMWEDR